MLSFPLPPVASLAAGIEALLRSRGTSIPLALQTTALTGVRMLDTAADCAALATAGAPYWSNAVLPATPPTPNTSLAGEALIGVIAGALGGVVLFFGFLAMKTPPDAEAAVLSTEKTLSSAAPATGGWRHRAGIRMRKLTKVVDMFALEHKLDPHHSPVLEPTPLGGTCSLLSIVTLLAIWAILILQRSKDNILRTVAVDAASEDKFNVAAAAATAPSSSGIAGMHVVVAAAGEPGACGTPVSWSASGLHAGAFSLTSRTCGIAAQHVFTCPGCIVTSGSALEVVLPWSCQAVYVQMIAASEEGELSVRNVTAAAPTPAEGADASSVKLLSALEINAPSMMLLQNDTTQKGFPMTRGYRLLGGTATRSTRLVTAELFTPATATVRIGINLEPVGIYQVSVAGRFAVST